MTCPCCYQQDDDQARHEAVVDGAEAHVCAACAHHLPRRKTTA